MGQFCNYGIGERKLVEAHLLIIAEIFERKYRNALAPFIANAGRGSLVLFCLFHARRSRSATAGFTAGPGLEPAQRAGNRALRA